MINIRKIIGRDFVEKINELNNYLASFLGSRADNKIGDTEFNEKLLPSITNGWSR